MRKSFWYTGSLESSDVQSTLQNCALIEHGDILTNLPSKDMGLRYTEVRANAPLHQVTRTGKHTGVWLSHTHLSDGVIITLKDNIWFLGSKPSPSFLSTLHSWALTAEAVWLVLQLLAFEQETPERNDPPSREWKERVSFQIQNSQNIKCSVNYEGSFKIQSVAMKGAANILY